MAVEPVTREMINDTVDKLIVGAIKKDETEVVVCAIELLKMFMFMQVETNELLRDITVRMGGLE